MQAPYFHAYQDFVKMACATLPEKILYVCKRYSTFCSGGRYAISSVPVSAAKNRLPAKILYYGIDVSLTHSSQHYNPDQLLFTRSGISSFPVVDRLC